MEKEEMWVFLIHAWGINAGLITQGERRETHTNSMTPSSFVVLSTSSPELRRVEEPAAGGVTSASALPTRLRGMDQSEERVKHL